MPKIAELREIDGAMWARIDMELGSPIQFLSPDEIEANRRREMKYLDEIERLTAENERLRAALVAVQDWLDTLPNAAGIRGFPKDQVDAAVLTYQQLGSRDGD